MLSRLAYPLLPLASVVVPLLLFAAGCESKNPPVPPETVNRMQTIYQAYNAAAEKLGRGPKDLEELKKFLPEGQNLDDLLKSPHDGKPYKLVFNVNPRTPPTSMFPPALAYEQEGKDGMYDVVTTMGVVRCNQEDLKKFIAATPGSGQ